MGAHVQIPEIFPCIQVFLLGEVSGKGIRVRCSCRLCGIFILSSASTLPCELLVCKSAAKLKLSFPSI